MKKRLISTILVLCLFIGILPAQAFAAQAKTDKIPFTDVSPDSWYYDQVVYAYENGLFEGTDSTTFSPNGTMTRGMYVAVIGRMVGIDADKYPGTSVFTDVPSDAYYAPYIKWAAELGIVSGISKDKFSPEEMITRQQMAAITVRLFDTMKYEFPESTVTSRPSDIDEIQDYAKDNVLKLWSCGMLVGDGGKFIPHQYAKRSEAASFLMSVHEYLAENYLNKTPEKPTDPDNPDPTKYHAVTFELGGQADAEVSLPKNKPYPKNTKLTLLPTPFKKNSIFLGWYYDAAMTLGVESDDVLDKDVTLYAKMASADGVSEIETPAYVTERGVSTSYSFKVKAVSADAVKSALTITQITANNKAVEYAVSDDGNGIFTIISDKYAPGQTYRASLTMDAGVVFVVSGEAQPETVISLNFVTAMEEVLNLDLNDAIIYIPVDDGTVTNMTGTAMEGLVSITVRNDGSNTIEGNTSDGTFDYSGNTAIDIGDTVSLYKGIKPSERTDAETDGSVVYVTITAKNGNTYTYTSADTEDVLFTPDVLPINSGDSTDGSVEVSSAELDFSDPKYAAAGLDATTTVDVGDYIAFYTGDMSAGMSGQYGVITGISQDGDTYTISYTSTTEDEMLKTMDIYDERNQEIEMTEEERKAIEDEMVRQATESGFVETAGEYLTSLALETKGFQEISEDMDLSGYDIEFEEGSQQELNEMDLMKTTIKIIKQSITATVALGSNAMQHFEDGSGLRAELALVFEVEITGESGNSIVINLSAIFAQEVLLDINISGGAKWEKSNGCWYIDDYCMNANIDFGSYTGIAVTATAYTKGAEDEADDFEWKTPGGASNLEKRMISIGAQITALMEKQEENEDEDIEFAGNPPAGLAAKYEQMIEAAEDCWIELFRVTIFEVEGFVDPFHVLAFGIGADFVVSANLYITLGMTFEYATAKRYNFSLALFSRKTTNETIDLEPAHYEFEFYVMGTLGIRAGIEFEMAIGLFSLKLDKIGITAEAGAYAQLWGYFHYMMKWVQNEGRTSTASGALYLEIGAYLEIGLIAQLFSSDKLTFAPTLYENSWPIWSVGEAENVNDFAYSQDETPEFILYNLKSQRMPDNLFTMGYMDLTTGESELEKAFAPNRFHVEFTNPAFSYNAQTGIISVNPEPASSLSEGGEMRITWGGAPLAFTSKPITRVMAITWAQQNEGRFIAFDTNGGSIVPMLFERPDTAIAPPAAPTKQGYVFDGWYTDEYLSDSFDFPNTMPDYEPTSDELRGITVYAKWVPATDTAYTVRYWQQTLGGNAYTKVDTATYRDGVTDSLTAVGEDKFLSYTGFTVQTPVTQQMVKPDGSTIVNVYYTRNIHDLTFVHGKGGENVVYQMKYGAKVYAPQLTADGYRFRGFAASADLPNFNAGTSTMPDHDVSFNSEWTANSYTITLVLGDGMANLEPIAYTTGNSVSLPSIISETREGYIFGGWCTNAAGKGDLVTEVSTTDSGYKTFYAKWTPNSYKVAFNANGGTGDMSEQGFAYGTEQNLTANTFKRAGFIFKGWSTSAASETVTYLDKARVNSLTAQDGGTIDLYAVWEAGEGTEYTVKHWQQNANDDQYTEVTNDAQTLQGKTDGKTEAVANTYAGFTDKTITQDAIKGDGSTVINVYYDRVTYTLTWNANGGSLGGNYSGKDTEGKVRFGATITAPTLNKPGSKGTWDLEIPTTMPANNLIFTAQWEESGFALTFVSDGAPYVDSYTPPIGFFEDEGATLPTADKFKYHTEADSDGNGWVFLGWYDNAQFIGTTYLTTEGITSDKTFYAKWFTGKVITTEAQLTAIKSGLSGKYCLYADITTSTGGWAAIPGIFTGQFHGNGHKITFGGNTAMMNANGLFQTIGKIGTVEGLTVSGVIMADGTKAVNAGGITAQNNGTISGCIADNLNITNIDAKSLVDGQNATYKTGTRHTGSIVGINSGTVVNCTVKNSSISASAGGITESTADYFWTFPSLASAGSIVGSNNGTISGCTAIDGIVNATRSGYYTYDLASAGGIAGINQKMIEKCSTENMQINSVRHQFNEAGTGAQENIEKIGSKTGGITGENRTANAKIIDCTVKEGTVGGLLAAGSAGNYNQGGIAGGNMGGTITGSSVSDMTIKGGGRLGGIVAFNSTETSVIEGCTVEKVNIVYDRTGKATGLIGGLIGLTSTVAENDVSETVTFKDCMVTDVTISMAKDTAGTNVAYIGGAVGSNSGDISGITVKRVTINTEKSNVDSFTVGGLVGAYSDNKAGWNGPRSYTIKNCLVEDFSAVDVKGTGSNGSMFGGMVGRFTPVKYMDKPHTATFTECVVGNNVTFTPFNGVAQPASNFAGYIHKEWDPYFTLADGGGNMLGGQSYTVTADDR